MVHDLLVDLHTLQVVHGLSRAVSFGLSNHATALQHTNGLLTQAAVRLGFAGVSRSNSLRHDKVLVVGRQLWLGNATESVVHEVVTLLIDGCIVAQQSLVVTRSRGGLDCNSCALLVDSESNTIVSSGLDGSVIVIIGSGSRFGERFSDFVITSSSLLVLGETDGRECSFDGIDMWVEDVGSILGSRIVIDLEALIKIAGVLVVLERVPE